MARNAIIVGGGVAGLTAGVALRRAGWEVQVLERSPELKPLGAGLSLWPNAVRALRAIGLEEIVDAPDVPRGGGALRRADGSALGAFAPSDIEERYGAPLVGVHRADLNDGLASALGPEHLRCDAGVSRVTDSGVRLVDGGELAADLIVGADGLHSVVREHICGAADPQDAEVVAYRGVTEWADEVPAGEWWSNGTVAGLLPLRGGRLYWYLAFRAPAAGNQAELAERVQQFGTPLPDVVASTPEAAVLFHNLFDRPPPERMADGTIALVGDAAHPMLPFLGQGACSAIEDAVALADGLEAEADIAAALAAYDRDRVRRTAKLVKGSRQAARIALASGPMARLRNTAMRAAPASARFRQLDGVIEG